MTPRNRAILLVALPFLMVLVLPGVVSAHHVPGTIYFCDEGEVCLYKHVNFNAGTSDKRCYTTQFDLADYSVTTWRHCTNHTNLSDNLNDDLSSAKNTSDTEWCFYCEHKNGGGSCLLTFENSSVTNFGDPMINLNDAVSSHDQV